MIEYLMISAVIMALFIVMLLLVNTNIMEDPANRVIYVSFTDIGNGVSTRIVDVYAIAPNEGDITTHFDIPDEIVGRGYFVELGIESKFGRSGHHRFPELSQCSYCACRYRGFPKESVEVLLVRE